MNIFIKLFILKLKKTNMKYSYKMSLNKKNIEKFEGTKIVMKSCQSTKDRNTFSKGKQTKRQTMIYNTLHRKLKFELHEPHKTGENSDSALNVIPVVLLLNIPNIT